MDVKIIHFAFILVLCLLQPVTSFSDDFQAYNLVSDAGFTSNYTIGAGTGIIAVAPDDSLTLNLTGAVGDYNVYLNITKANLSYPATFSATLRSNSSFELAVIDTIYSRFTMFIYTNTTDESTDNLTTSHGYRFDYLVNPIDGGIASITLRRCATGINVYNCGVLLNTTSHNQSLDGFYYDGSSVINIQDIIFKVTIDSSKIMRFYANDILLLATKDSAESYLSGGVALGFYSDRNPAFAYIDNIGAVAGITETPTDWQIIAFPQAWSNWVGFGDFVINETYNGVPTNCARYYLSGTNYYTSQITSLGCEEWYEYAYPINTLLDPTFVLTHTNKFWTQFDVNTNNVNIEAYISAPKANVCTLLSTTGATTILPANMPYGGATTTFPLFLNSSSDVLFTPLLYRSFMLTCDEQINLTYSIAISENSTYFNPTYIINMTIPIGCPFDSLGNINCSILVDQTNKSLYKRIGIENIVLCQEGDTRPECQGLNRVTNDFDTIIGALFSWTMIFLYIFIAISTFVAKYTRNGLFGLAIMLIGISIMTYVGLIGTWFMYMIIVITALVVAIVLLKTK